MTARERVEAEAWERWPDITQGANDPLQRARRDAFTAGRTASAEQTEVAEDVISDALNEQEHAASAWSGPRNWQSATEVICAVFHAAGFIVEGED